MITTFQNIAFDYHAHIIDSGNNSIDMSLASTIGMVISNVSTGSISGLIIGSAVGTSGGCVFPIAPTDVANHGVYDVTISYTVGGITETTFGSTLIVIHKEAVPTVAVESGVDTTVEFQITDAAGNHIDLTAIALLMFTITDANAVPVPKTYSAVNLSAGIISATFNEIDNLYGFFTTDTILTTEFLLNPVPL